METKEHSVHASTARLGALRRANGRGLKLQRRSPAALGRAQQANGSDARLRRARLIGQPLGGRASWRGAPARRRRHPSPATDAR